ncbi:MAG: hypothetical protein JSV04_01820 [Candidatus Heimdallarchaeota archaeon]|nr:MAG: hypothetical protein JSV04_01820 [Candidatus Heimdallarchaeota archaeon]
MSNIPFFLFPEFKNQIEKESVRKSLDLVESVIGFSKGKCLGQKDILRITEKLGPRMKGTRMYAGGSSVLFGWSFNFEKIGFTIIKPYYSRELAALIIHYFTSIDFKKEFQEIDFKFENKEIKVTVPKVVGLAKIGTLSRFFPVLIMMEATGETIKTPSLIKNITQIVRDLAQKGIICDPYPSNWKISFDDNQGNVQYIDLLSSNKLTNIHSRIAELVQFLNK